MIGNAVKKYPSIKLPDFIVGYFIIVLFKDLLFSMIQIKQR